MAGGLAQRLGQPAVLGELIGGVLAGPSVLGWVDPDHETIQLLAELGVVILLFAIGLETDLAQLLRVGATSLTVAVVGVLPAVRTGIRRLPAAGLSDLRVDHGRGDPDRDERRHHRPRALRPRPAAHPEGQIILGAALIDDVLGPPDPDDHRGASRRASRSPRRWSLATTGRAHRLLAGGDRRRAAGSSRCCFGWRERIELPGTVTVFALVLALVDGMAGRSVRLGDDHRRLRRGLAPGRGCPRAHEIERGITALGHFFVPIFFVSVGASVDLSALNPLEPASRFALLTGGVLIVVGIVGKLLAGYAPFWFRGNKTVIGVGMIPRGEVGLIFAQIGLASRVFDAGLFGAATLMVIVTTARGPAVPEAAPGPSADRGSSRSPEAIEDLVTEA